MKLIKNNNKVVDFAMSDNILVVLDDKGSAFYSGLDKTFILQKIDFFEDKKIVSIGASHNNYILVDNTGEVFQRESVASSDYELFFGNK